MTKRELIAKLHENGAIWANDSYTKADLQKFHDEMTKAQQMTIEELKAKAEEANIKAEMKKEDKSMTSINEIKTTFTFEGRDYTEKTNGYCFVTENGKTRRIKAAELEQAFDSYIKAGAEKEQAELDAEPCKVEVENDLEKPAVLNEYGCVDCSECRVEHCVHRNCMRRNPRSESGLAECPRLHVKDEKIGLGDDEHEGLHEDLTPEQEEKAMKEAEEWLANEDAKRHPKKARKPRKSKDIAYEGHGVTLTAKQVDFIHHLPDTCFWENGVESTIWVDCLCDDIGGQFAGKPMTVGAMISTLCEKGLGSRCRDRSRKGNPVAFDLSDLGQKIATELGLK